MMNEGASPLRQGGWSVSLNLYDKPTGFDKKKMGKKLLTKPNRSGILQYFLAAKHLMR